eukprot:gene10668-12354_t
MIKANEVKGSDSVDRSESVSKQLLEGMRDGMPVASPAPARIDLDRLT